MADRSRATEEEAKDAWIGKVGVFEDHGAAGNPAECVNLCGTSPKISD